MSDASARPCPILRYWLTALAVVVALWAALFWAPVSEEVRMHGTFNTDYIKSGWIYDRLHHDNTPIDIAFFGSSRMLQAVDPGRLESTLNAGSAFGLHVENLAIPGLGRDSELLMLRQTLATKRPRLVIFELDYLEAVAPNTGFPLLTSGPELLDMPLLVNRDLPYDLLFVAAHNLRLLWDDWLGKNRFDPAQYAGPHWNGAEFNRGRNGQISAPRAFFPPAEQLRRDAERTAGYERRKAGQYDSWAWLELRYNEVLMRRTLELTKQSGARIVFLYMPPVGMAEPPFNDAMLRQYGDIWRLPADIEGNYRYWTNPTHPNMFGARRISDWLAGRLAEEAAKGALPSR